MDLKLNLAMDCRLCSRDVEDAETRQSNIFRIMACLFWLVLAYVVALSASLPVGVDDADARPRVPLTEAAHRHYAAVTLSSGSATLHTLSSRHEMQHFVDREQPPAWGWFQDDIETTGWSTLEVHTNENHEDGEQSYAAGYLEGALTHYRVSQALANNAVGVDSWSPTLKAYVDKNDVWIHNETLSKSNSDSSYWHHVTLLYRQFDGLYDGFLAHTTKDTTLSRTALYALSLTGDLDDLCPAFGCKGSSHVHHGDDHCSVLIKVLRHGQGVVKDVIAGHTTWSSFESMLRIYKHYDFPFSVKGPGSARVAARRVAFSGYPGMLFGLDDWYQASSNLVITETTNANHNQSLWSRVQPEGVVLDWVRTMLATRLASNGEEWTELYGRYNSGTYNNQWMVVDYNKLKDVISFTSMPQQQQQQQSKASPPSGFLWVLEQMPGVIERHDMTAYLLDHDKWVSYNRPFYTSVFNISGQNEMEKAFGPHYSWSATARAQIFDRLAPSVTDERSYERVMRHNKFQQDPEGRQGCKHGKSGSNAIAERGDLTLVSADCIDDISQIDEAAIDLKYTTGAMMMRGGGGDHGSLKAIAISGPTSDDQPVFKFSTSPFDKVPHEGLPDAWDFPWVEMSWEG